MENTSGLAEAIPMVSTLVFAVFPVIFAIVKIISIMPRLSALFFVVVVVISVLITAYEYCNAKTLGREEKLRDASNIHTDEIHPPFVEYSEIETPSRLSHESVKRYRKDIQSEIGGDKLPRSIADK
jgi:hypothetical protein